MQNMQNTLWGVFLHLAFKPKVQKTDRFIESLFQNKRGIFFCGVRVYMYHFVIEFDLGFLLEDFNSHLIETVKTQSFSCFLTDQ